MSVLQHFFLSEGNKNENKNGDIASHFQNQFMITVTCTCTVILYYDMYMPFPPWTEQEQNYDV